MTWIPRPLNARQARLCENAVSPAERCRCRCAGAKHSAGRSALPEFFEMLPRSDPHFIPERSRQLPLPAPVGVK